MSPLRYPGAKRRLSGYIGEVLRLNDLRPKIFVEPFAGVASVALQMLSANLVDTIALGEKDPLLASFWKTVFYDSDWLIEQINEIDVTIERWRYFRKLQSSEHLYSDRERALACLFLNRTSFSGILAGAGPIGGYSQRSEYKIDCRFMASTITLRIAKISALRDRVAFVEKADWKDFVCMIERLNYKQDKVFYYFDPPFYQKAKRLYTFYFLSDDHKSLHDFVVTLQQPWLLSYDPAEAVEEMYTHNGRGPKRIDHLYSLARMNRLVTAQELIITNLDVLPKETRIWMSTEEWKR